MTPEHLTLSNLAERAGITPAQAYRVLSSTDKSFVNPEGGYNLTEFLDYVLEHPESVESVNANGTDENFDDLPLKEQDLLWKIERQKKSCRKLDLDYEQQIGELIPRQQVRESLAKAFAPICLTLERHLDRKSYNVVCEEIRSALSKLENTVVSDASKRAKRALATSNKETPDE